MFWHTCPCLCEPDKNTVLARAFEEHRSSCEKHEKRVSHSFFIYWKLSDRQEADRTGEQHPYHIDRCR